MHKHHGKWIWGLSQLSQSLKALGSSLCQLSYTKQQWINLPLSAPQRKYLLLASANQVLYITYFSKSPQQYHSVYMTIIINGVHINSVHVSHLWWDSMSHSHGIRAEPSRGWATFRIHVFLFLSCISQVNETICFHPHHSPPLCLRYSIRIFPHPSNLFLNSDLYFHDQLQWWPGFPGPPSSPSQVKMRDFPPHPQGLWMWLVCLLYPHCCYINRYLSLPHRF